MSKGPPTTEGRQTGIQAEFNFGWGATTGGQIQIFDGGWGVGSGLSGLVQSLSTKAVRLKDGIGFGAHVSLGITNTRTIIIRRESVNAGISRDIRFGQVRLREWSRSGGKR
jgi:hypothetical protein